MEVRDTTICTHIRINGDVHKFTVIVMVIMAIIILSVSLKISRTIEDTEHPRG